MDTTSGGPLRTILRIFFGALLVIAFLLFILWRTENPRLQRFRLALVDFAAPALESVAGPSTALARLFEDVQSFSDLKEENARLLAEVERLRRIVEIAERLEEENARLRRLNAVTLPPSVTFVTAEVIGDAGGPFGHSLLLNVGARNGVHDGAPAVDAGGLVGRIFGVGEVTARVLLLTDPSSRIPVAVGPERSRAILTGDNAADPVLQYLTTKEAVEVGARVVTTGQGGVFPRGLTVGRVVAGEDGVARVRLAADYRRLEFVRVLRSALSEPPPATGGVILTPVVSGDLSADGAQ